MKRARQAGGCSPDITDAAEVMVRRSSIAACVTCGLCGRFLRDATAISECLHVFCRECIVDEFNHKNTGDCPKCGIELGSDPLEKLRPDHNLECIGLVIFPSKRCKFEEISSLQPAVQDHSEAENLILREELENERAGKTAAVEVGRATGQEEQPWALTPTPPSPQRGPGALGTKAAQATSSAFDRSKAVESIKCAAEKASISTEQETVEIQRGPRGPSDWNGSPNLVEMEAADKEEADAKELQASVEKMMALVEKHVARSTHKTKLIRHLEEQAIESEARTRQEIANLSGENSQLRTEITQLRAELMDAQGTLRVNRQAKADVEKEVERLRGKVKDLEGAVLTARMQEEKAVGDLKEYRSKVLAQFQDLNEQLSATQAEVRELKDGIAPMLDLVDPIPKPSESNPQPTCLLDRLVTAPERVKDFVKWAARYAVRYTLVVVKSHYPSADLKAIGEGFAAGLTPNRAKVLCGEIKKPSRNLTDKLDLSLFRKREK